MNLFSFLLQVTTPNNLINTATANTSVTEVPSENLWQLLTKGGPLMIPLGLLFVLALYFFIQRLLIVRKVDKLEQNFMHIIKDHIYSGNVMAARSVAKSTNHPIARVIEKGIQRIGKPIDAIEKSMLDVGRNEMFKLEKNLDILSTISRIAPLFGFLGTLIGLVLLLKQYSTDANPSISQIADSMYVKLITSATGLIIGVISYLFYNYLDRRLNNFSHKMELATGEFLDILQEPTK